MYDTVYFTSKCSPDGKDWMHCTVTRFNADGLVCTTQLAYQTQRYHFPAHVVLRVEYAKR